MINVNHRLSWGIVRYVSLLEANSQKSIPMFDHISRLNPHKIRVKIHEMS